MCIQKLILLLLSVMFTLSFAVSCGPNTTTSEYWIYADTDSGKLDAASDDLDDASAEETEKNNTSSGKNPNSSIAKNSSYDNTANGSTVQNGSSSSDGSNNSQSSTEISKESYAERAKSKMQELDKYQFAVNTMYQNNYRIKRVLDKIHSGEEVNIVFLGGSCTYGAGATAVKNNLESKTINQIKRLYPDANINYYNAGLGSTNHVITSYYGYDAVLNRNPDLVIIDLAVNGKTTGEEAESYEAIVNRIYNHRNKPAIALLTLVLAGDYSDEAGPEPGYRHTDDFYFEIAEKYGLPILDMREYVWENIEKQAKGWTGYKTDYGADVIHPNDKGHTKISEMITYWIAQAECDNASATDKTVSVLSNKFMNAQGIDSFRAESDSAITVNKGDFLSAKDGGFTAEKANIVDRGWTAKALTAKPLVLQGDVFKNREICIVLQNYGAKDVKYTITFDDDPNKTEKFTKSNWDSSKIYEIKIKSTTGKIEIKKVGGTFTGNPGENFKTSITFIGAK